MKNLPYDGDKSHLNPPIHNPFSGLKERGGFEPYPGPGPHATPPAIPGYNGGGDGGVI